MSVHSYRAKLALDLIKEHFGDLVYEVAMFLIRSDRVALQEILREFQPSMGRGKARDCLLVLHRHNILLIDFKPIFSTTEGTLQT